MELLGNTIGPGPKLRQQPGPGPDRLGLKCYLAWGGSQGGGGGGGKG